jgi:hypothetical protein
MTRLQMTHNINYPTPKEVDRAKSSKNPHFGGLFGDDLERSKARLNTRAFAPISMNKTKPETLKHPQALAEALNFTEDDLIANQQGILGENQIKRLGDQLREKIVWILGLPLLLFLLGIFALIFSSRGIAGFAFMLLMISILSNPNRYLHFFKWYRDYRLQQVVTAEGLIELKILRGVYSAQLGDLAFGLNSNAMFVFKTGDPYRLHYLPESLTLLSAEWLRDDNPFMESPQ